MQLVAKISSSNSKFLLEDRFAIDSGRKKVLVYDTVLRF